MKFDMKRSHHLKDNYNDYCHDDDHLDEKVDDQEDNYKEFQHFTRRNNLRLHSILSVDSEVPLE